MIQLREYQEHGSTAAAEILRKRHMVYLSWEVRCGKTLTAFATLQKVGAERCLFVTKKKAIKSIQADAEAIGFDAVVINYESLHKVTEAFRYIVVDEAHTCGAFPKPSLRQKLLKKLINVNTYVIFLSGTASPESFSQLYHQFALHPLNPFHQYRNFYAWAKDFVTVREKYVGVGQKVNDYSEANWKKIQPYVKPLMMDRTQAESGFTQTIVEHVLTVRMKESTYAIAEAVAEHGIYEGNTDTILADTAVKRHSKVHQLYSGTVIAEGGTHIIDRTKAKAIARHFAGRKIAVFTVYQAEADMVRQEMPNCTSSPEDFNADPTATYVGQIRSSREGVNLSSAECLVYLNIEHSSLSYLQGRDRATSKDRATPPEVWFVFAENGIEEDIYDVVQTKRDYTLQHFKQWQKLTTRPS
jgi:hypothetical protein